MSAIADIRSDNKEIASLEEIANIMYDRNDLIRANDYIRYSLDCANDYKSRARVGRLAALQHRITTAYQRETEEQESHLHRLFIVLSLIVLLVIGILVFSAVQNRKLRLSRAAAAGRPVSATAGRGPRHCGTGGIYPCLER